MTIQTYMVTRPIQVYRIGSYEVEANYLWDALSSICHAHVDYGVYGTNQLDPEIQSVLLEAGLIVETSSGIRILPSDSFEAFYAEMVESLKHLNRTDETIWKLDEPPKES